MSQPVYKCSEKTPQVSGYYWWKCEQEQPDKALMVNLTMREDGTLSSYFIYGEGPSFHCCEKCLFAGPILEPMESDICLKQ